MSSSCNNGDVTATSILRPSNGKVHVKLVTSACAMSCTIILHAHICHISASLKNVAMTMTFNYLYPLNSGRNNGTLLDIVLGRRRQDHEHNHGTSFAGIGRPRDNDRFNRRHMS
jgi:hypothetical protein